MIGTIVKLIILVVMILVGLKIFAPEIYEDATDKISETTGVNKSIIDDNLDKVKDMAVESTEKLTDAAKDGIDKVKEKVSE